MTMPPEGYALFRSVQQATQGTPYVVTETDEGFDVTLDVVDAEWFGLFNKAGLGKVYIHHVSFPGDGAYTIADDSRTVEWVAGVPTLKASAEREYGRVIELGAQKVWAFDSQGHFGVQADYRFNSEEGRDLITGLAEAQGLKKRRGKAEGAGLYVGIIAAVLAVIVLVVNLIAWLAGYYG